MSVYLAVVVLIGLLGLGYYVLVELQFPNKR